MTTSLLLAAALSLLPAPLRAAADIMIRAGVDKTSVALNDQIVLEVSVAGPSTSMPEPKLPSLPNFSVYSSANSHNISFINGKVSSSIVYTYVLVPRFVGKAVIGPVAVTTGGTTVQTDPIEIEVVPPAGTRVPGQGPASPRPSPSGARPSPGAPDIFVMADVDKKKPFVNEQVTLSVKFFTSVQLLGNPQYDTPKISGFLAEDLPPERHGNIEHHGRSYYYSEIKTALFPASAGKHVVGPATVRAQIQRDVTIDPYAPDFFQRFFSQGLVGAEDKVLSSEPVEIRADPLPSEGKPPDFTGAVGRFSVSAAIDRTEPKAGEAVNLTVTVQGTGNIKALGDLKLPDMPSFRVYDTVSSLSLDRTKDVVNGSKVFKTVLVPKVSGPLTIPSITFSYFDPSKRQYVQASTPALRLKVGEGDAAASAAVAASAPAGRLSAVSEDIRYLKLNAESSALSRLLEAVASAGNAHTAPFLLFAAVLSMTMYQEREASDPKGKRFRGALKAARKRLTQAAALKAEDPKRASSLLSEALTHYLGDKLDAPASGLTLRRVIDLLAAKAPGLGSREHDEVREMWEELDLLRFAPSAPRGKGADPAEKLASLLKILEKAVRR
ncbi:MAG: protein BatD [Elusimicrobia bacterium]|nr:protein BatD [Elusimicrobiota bacterium]